MDLIPLAFTVTLFLLAVLQIEGFRLMRWRRSFMASLPSWQLRMPSSGPAETFLQELYRNRLK